MGAVVGVVGRVGGGGAVGVGEVAGWNPPRGAAVTGWAPTRGVNGAKSGNGRWQRQKPATAAQQPPSTNSAPATALAARNNQIGVAGVIVTTVTGVSSPATTPPTPNKVVL